jgi:hypothetical protein
MEINKSSEKVNIIKIDPALKCKMQDIVHQKKLKNPKSINLLMNFINECMSLEITLPNVKFTKVTAYIMFKKSKATGDWKMLSKEEKAKYQVMADEENFIRRENAIKTTENHKEKIKDIVVRKKENIEVDFSQEIGNVVVSKVDEEPYDGELYEGATNDYIKYKLADNSFSAQESVDYMVLHGYSREDALDFISKISKIKKPSTTITRKNHIDSNSRPRYIQDELKEKLNEEELNGWYKAKIIWKH